MLDTTPKRGSRLFEEARTYHVRRSQEITYPDGSKGTAWVGIHLTDAVATIGSPWCSRKPTVVGEILLGPNGGVVFGTWLFGEDNYVYLTRESA